MTAVYLLELYQVYIIWYIVIYNAIHILFHDVSLVIDIMNLSHVNIAFVHVNVTKHWNLRHFIWTKLNYACFKR